jgi:hypothetical protein
MKYYSPKKSMEELKEKEKIEAVNAYIKTKTLMVGNELDLYPNQARDTETLDPFEFYAMIVSKAGDFKEKIPILNSEAFFLFQNYLPVAFSDAGIKSPTLDIIGDTATLASFVELCGAIETTTKAEKAYQTEKGKGAPNYYSARNAYIDYALSSANMLATYANYLSGQYNFSVGVPSADIDAILKMVKELANKRDLQDYYRHLVAEESIINRKPEMVNDILRELNIPVFAAVDNNEYDSENKICAAMKKGPTAKEIAEAIPFILQKAEKNSNSTAYYEKSTSQKIAESLWYYYGWRLEYEYSMFIEWIYKDEPCDFQSYLKNTNLVE